MATRKPKETTEIMDADSIWNQMDREFGGGTIFKASDPIEFNEEIIECPSPSMGDAIGVLGWPLGRISQFHGKEGCGKSFFAMLNAKQAQIQYPDSDVLWIDAESSASIPWFEKIGVDLKRLRIVKMTNATDIFNMLCGRYKDGKKVSEGILDHVIAKKLNIRYIVLDSLAAIIPPAEEGRDLDEYEMSAMARFLPKALRRLRSKLKPAGCHFTIINQARDNMNPMAKNVVYSGGRSLKHCLDFAIRVEASTATDGKLENKFGKYGHKVFATVEKCRGGSNGHQAEIWLDFNTGVVRLGEEVAKLADSYGVLNRPTKVTWEYNGTSVVGADNFYNYLDSNVDIRNQIWEAVKAKKAEGANRTAALSADGAALAAENGEAAFADDGTPELLDDTELAA